MGQQELKLAGRSSEKPRKRKCTEASDVFHVQKPPTPADKSSRREWAHACLPGLSQAPPWEQVARGSTCPLC